VKTCDRGTRDTISKKEPNKKELQGQRKNIEGEEEEARRREGQRQLYASY